MAGGSVEARVRVSSSRSLILQGKKGRTAIQLQACSEFDGEYGGGLGILRRVLTKNQRKH